MTTEEQSLADDKMRAEIAKLAAETIKIGNETRKIGKEIKWYEMVIISGATLAIVAIVKVFL